MTEVLDLPTPSGPMSPEEQEIAERIYTAIQHSATKTERGQQAAEFRVGLSDLGYCSERTRRMLGHEVPEDTDMFLAWLGTVIGEGVERAMVEHFGEEIIAQAEVVCPIRGETREYEVLGHPDIIIPSLGLVLDGKTAYGLRLAERLGADTQKQFQRHGYGKGAWLEGHFGDLPLEDVRVGNFWLDRSGKERRVHVQIEPYSDEVLAEAGRWLDEVVYNFTHQQEATKEPPREVCFATCGFYDTCRGLDTDVTGLIRDREAVGAIDLYVEGNALEKRGKAMKSEAKANLLGVSGSTGTYSLRWVEVDSVEVAGFTRAPHRRIDIKPVRRGKV